MLATSQSLRILVVEDNESDFVLFCEYLILSQLPTQNIFRAERLGEALHLLHDHQPDLIFLDLNMAKLSGKDTLKLISDNSRFAEVPVIIYSTSRNKKEKEEMLVMGARDFYSKPYDLNGLITIVEKVKTKWLSTLPKKA